MPYTPVWMLEAREQYDALKDAALATKATRERRGKRKSSRQEGLFKQVNKAISLLLSNPKHPSLQTHPYQALQNPYGKGEKVFEAYAQQNTPSAYRIFWCYGPQKAQITIIAITRHPGH